MLRCCCCRDVASGSKRIPEVNEAFHSSAETLEQQAKTYGVSLRLNTQPLNLPLFMIKEHCNHVTYLLTAWQSQTRESDTMLSAAVVGTKSYATCSSMKLVQPATFLGSSCGVPYKTLV